MVPVDDDAFFWDGVDEGHLLVRACAACARTQHPPTPMCPACGSVAWTTQPMATHGTVLSWITSHHPSELDADPRIVVLVELDDGHRLVANLHGVEPVNGLAVEAIVVEVDGVRLPGFAAG